MMKYIKLKYHIQEQVFETLEYKKKEVNLHEYSQYI
jgi:hypothetical protein